MHTITIFPECAAIDFLAFPPCDMVWHICLFHSVFCGVSNVPPQPMAASHPGACYDSCTLQFAGAVFHNPCLVWRVGVHHLLVQ